MIILLQKADTAQQMTDLRIANRKQIQGRVKITDREVED